MNKDSSQCGYSPKAYIATLNWKAVCGESRTHGLEGAVEGRPSTATLRFTGLEDLQDTNFHGGFYHRRCAVGFQNSIYPSSVKKTNVNLYLTYSISIFETKFSYLLGLVTQPKWDINNSVKEFIFTRCPCNTELLESLFLEIVCKLTYNLHRT